MNEYTITTESISQIIADIPPIREKGEPSYEFKIWSHVLDKILQNYYGKYWLTSKFLCLSVYH